GDDTPAATPTQDVISRSPAAPSHARASNTPTPALHELERHLDVLGMRAAALDAAAATMRRHIEVLRGHSNNNGTAVQHQHQDNIPVVQRNATSVQDDTTAPSTYISQDLSTVARQDEAPADARTPSSARAWTNLSLPTPSTAAASPDVQAHAARTELLVSARAAIAGERMRLSGMQERLSVLGGRSPAPAPASSSTQTASAPTTTLVAPSPAPPTGAPSSSPALSPALRTLVRDQTALLARVGGLIADMGVRLGVSVGALENAVRSASVDNAASEGNIRSAASGGTTGFASSASVGNANAGNAAMLALVRARETLARADRTLRRADADAIAVRGRLEGILDADAPAGIDVDTDRHGDVRPGAGAANEEDKRPIVVSRRTFFER
ncbi:hypothetical protein B0H12DRAFT_1077194, partial [Mycena haematopus]